MKKTLFNLLQVLLLSTLITMVSCDKKDDTPAAYTGEITVSLINKGSSKATEGDEASFSYGIVMSKSSDQDITLNFALDNADGLLSIDGPVLVKKNQTKGELIINAKSKTDSENILTESKNFNITLSGHQGIKNDIKLISKEVITIEPEEGFVPLTDEQKKLVEHYKTQGIDLTPWIGKIAVETKVQTDGLGAFAPFDEASTKTYSGTTYITLSEHATKEKPLLVMRKNALGLSDYLQYVFRKETIENTVYWNNPQVPASTAVLNAISKERVDKWKNKEYSFDVILDKIELQADNKIKFVYENGAFGNPHKEGDPTAVQDDEYELLTAVNFQYSFELWDIVLEMAKADKDLYEDITTGGSLHPDFYITYSLIDEDDWSESNWVKPEASYDNSKGEMNFTFNIDHSSSGDYDIINVKLTSPYSAK